MSNIGMYMGEQNMSGQAINGMLPREVGRIIPDGECGFSVGDKVRHKEGGIVGTVRKIEESEGVATLHVFHDNNAYGYSWMDATTFEKVIPTEVKVVNTIKKVWQYFWNNGGK